VVLAVLGMVVDLLVFVWRLLLAGSTIHLQSVNGDILYEGDGIGDGSVIRCLAIRNNLLVVGDELFHVGVFALK